MPFAILCVLHLPCESLPDQVLPQHVSFQPVLRGRTPGLHGAVDTIPSKQSYQVAGLLPQLMHLRGGKGKKERERTAARRAKNHNAGKGGEDEVGLPYQTSTPLMNVHEDIPQTRDARSYAAEAARCLVELDPDSALACYEEALKLEPRACWLLDAYGSLLADLGRCEAVDINLWRANVFGILNRVRWLSRAEWMRQWTPSTRATPSSLRAQAGRHPTSGTCISDRPCWEKRASNTSECACSAPSSRSLSISPSLYILLPSLTQTSPQGRQDS